MFSKLVLEYVWKRKRKYKNILKKIQKKYVMFRKIIFKICLSLNRITAVSFFQIFKRPCRYWIENKPNFKTVCV